MNLDTLENLLLALLVADALALAVLVLIQQGKGADAGAAFGGGGSNTMFGGSGSTSFLAKLTSWLAIGFFAIAFGLAYTAKERAGSLSDLGIPKVTAPLSGIGEAGTGLLDQVETAVEDSDVPVFDADIDAGIDVPSLDGEGIDLPVEIDPSVLTDELDSVDSTIPDL